MNDFEFLQAYLSEEPQAAAGTTNAAEEFLQKPKEGGVTVHPGKAVPEKIDAPKVEDKPVKKHIKESLLPQVRKVADAKEKAGTVLGAAVPDISEVPVPSGGIGLLLFISLLMVFAITPVNGQTGATRLSLLWGTMLGNYSINKGTTIAGKGGGKKAKDKAPSAPSIPNASGGMDSLIQGGLYT